MDFASIDQQRAAGPGSRVQGGPGEHLYPQIIPFAFPGVSNVGCAFSTGLAGSIALGQDLENGENIRAVSARKRLLGYFSLKNWVELNQVHKDTLLVDPQATLINKMSGLDADGSCTRAKGLALAVKSADCQPLLLADKKGTAIAALHVGWRGNAINFPGSGLARFCEAYGLEPSEVLAVRGPSLGPGAAQFVNFSEEWLPAFTPWYNEQTKCMDLWSLTRNQLRKAGLPDENIFSLDMCTWSLSDLFFSHRRGHLGRQVSIIWLRENV